MAIFSVQLDMHSTLADPVSPLSFGSMEDIYQQKSVPFPSIPAHTHTFWF